METLSRSENRGQRDPLQVLDISIYIYNLYNINYTQLLYDTFETRTIIRGLTFETSDSDFRELVDEVFHMAKEFFLKQSK